MPEADEATEDEHHKGLLSIADVVEGCWVEDHADVEEEKQVSGGDPQPVDVVAPVGRLKLQALTPSRARPRRTGSQSRAQRLHGQAGDGGPSADGWPTGRSFRG